MGNELMRYHRASMALPSRPPTLQPAQRHVSSLVACTTSTLGLRKWLEPRITSHRAVTPSSPRSNALVAEPARAAPSPLPFPIHARAVFVDPYVAPPGKFQWVVRGGWWLVAGGWRLCQG